MTDKASDAIMRVLQNGWIEIEGLLPWSSNYAFLVRVCDDAEVVEAVKAVETVEAVYKPQRGERPLWDFPQGALCYREQAAFIVSEALGWCIIPPTVLRDAQHGPGTIQQFIDHDPERHYFTIEGNSDYRPQLQRIALLDIVINNADRKAGHVLIEEPEEPGAVGQLWGIDHGICFHTDPKLRTVIWEFAGTPIPPEMKADLAVLRDQLQNGNDDLVLSLGCYLTTPEIEAMIKRLDRLIKQESFPAPGPGRHYPWPPV
ncbi:MAG: SCO1664 family protein [Candidatus Promineofilum sp.]|nr:SCO1664 family protein [Promineifilum sp.]